MKHIRLLAQYYVDLMVKLGLVRFSLLLASALVVLALIVQLAVTLLLHGQVTRIDVVRSVFFGLLITPWAVYFLSVVVEQLEDSRQRLVLLVDKLEELRIRDTSLNQQMQLTIEQMNQEINVRKKAEQAREQAINKLREEMSGREQAQIKLEQQTSFLRSFLDASPDLVFYRNLDKQFLGCNRAMELLTGKNEKQLIGLTPGSVYDAETARKILETDDQVFKHNVTLTYEQWLCYPDGRKACFEIRKVPYYDWLGQRNGLMGFGRDITERKRYQEALENASREKSTFISTISHELRTPLNGIVGLSRILLDTSLDQEQLNYLKTIHVSAITLGNIFNDVIEMDKIERRKVKLDNQPINFTDFLSDLKNLAGLLVQSKGLSLRMVLAEKLPEKVLADGTRLRQILWNLISNAVKFTPSGEVIIRVSYRAHEKLCFEVEDSGIGIPVSEQDKIFAMYYQVTDRDGGKPATGTGIGLAISRRIAQAMGGDLTVTSQPGQGACFTAEIIAPILAQPLELTEQNDELPLPALHVLLVEDIELNIIVARSVLEKMGCSVEVAMTGRQALAMFDPAEFDMVLLDIQLPDMTGLEVAKQIHHRYHMQALPPLVALTANVLKERQLYLDAGMSDVLSKPLSVNALTTTIKTFWDTPVNGEEDEVTTHSVIPESYHFDWSLLEQYIQITGIDVIEQSIQLFEKMMPDYLDVLDCNLIAKDQQAISEQGHKIKGAAAAIGLIHLQKIASQIQSPELPAWWDNVQDWIEELHRTWQSDVALLKEGLEKYRSNN